MHFRKNSHISGILLNSCSEKLYKMLKDLLERETGLPVLGYLPACRRRRWKAAIWA